MESIDKKGVNVLKMGTGADKSVKKYPKFPKIYLQWKKASLGDRSPWNKPAG